MKWIRCHSTTTGRHTSELSALQKPTLVHYLSTLHGCAGGPTVSLTTKVCSTVKWSRVATAESVGTYNPKYTNLKSLFNRLKGLHHSLMLYNDRRADFCAL